MNDKNRGMGGNPLRRSESNSSPSVVSPGGPHPASGPRSKTHFDSTLAAGSRGSQTLRSSGPGIALELPSAGAIIDGTYQVLGVIGSGAMGIVLSAYDRHLDREVAIKMVRPELASPEFRQLFISEARAMALVNHPNVLSIHAFGEYRTIPYFAMELVDGQTLESWLAGQKDPIDLDEAVRIMDAICLGVTAIHEAGAVHRDIKPSNILLDHDRRPRVTDLGVAVLYRGAAKQAERAGTPAYMAPEVAFPEKDEKPSPRADVYSLGCMAYELLTRKLPFDVQGGLISLLRDKESPLPPPSSFRGDLPTTFDDVLGSALAKDPQQRTPTVALFRRSLESALNGSREPVRILVAEDDDDFRELLKAKLQHEFPDAELECVSNGRDALNAFENRGASVAIFDLQMPQLDGIRLTEKLRARTEASHMPIIMLTASGGPEEWKRLRSVGADRFLIKPVNLDDVVTLIRRSMRERVGHAPQSER